MCLYLILSFIRLLLLLLDARFCSPSVSIRSISCKPFLGPRLNRTDCVCCFFFCLFYVVCAISSRYYADKSEIYPIAMHFAKHAAANALVTGTSFHLDFFPSPTPHPCFPIPISHTPSLFPIPTPHDIHSLLQALINDVVWAFFL